MSEDVWEFISSITDEKQHKYELDENSHLADRELFTNINEQNLIFISPEPLEETFIQYFKQLSGIREVTVLVPDSHSGLICEDILRDTTVLDRLISEGHSSEHLVIKSYSASKQFYKLLKRLKKESFQVTTPESPAEEDSWTVNFYGSKSGIRQLIDKLHKDNIQMAPGVICSGAEDAAILAASWYIRHKGVVIKTHKGHAGAGVLLYKNGSLPSEFTECKETILQTLKKDRYWDLFPIIVESFVDTDKSISDGFPNIEYKILPDGTIKPLYPCGMRVSPEGVFMGVEIHSSIFTKEMTNQLISLGNTIAEQYVQDGYRGNFEFDFAAGKDGQLYITESNVRKTGGTYVYETARKLAGEDFLDTVYVLSTNVYKLTTAHIYTFDELLKTLEPLLYSSQTGEGVIIASANLLKQKCIGYIVIGKNKTNALSLETKMKDILAKN